MIFNKLHTDGPHLGWTSGPSSSASSFCSDGVKLIALTQSKGTSGPFTAGSRFSVPSCTALHLNVTQEKTNKKNQTFKLEAVTCGVSSYPPNVLGRPNRERQHVDMMTSHLPGGSERCCSRNCLDYIHDEPAIQSCGVSSESSWLQHVWFVCPLLFTQCLTCIGITDNESCGAFAYGLNEWSHLFCPQSTVQTNTAQRKEEGSYWEAICITSLVCSTFRRAAVGFDVQ